jgi:prefoldin subunit 5
MKPHEKLGVSIANAGYSWTSEMRSAWEELDKKIDDYERWEKKWSERVAKAEKTKAITDEEINELYADYQNPDYYSREVIFDQLGFARAILRKAQE